MRIRARSGRAVSLLLRRPVSYRGLTFCFECWRARTGCVVMASTAYSVAAGSRLQQRRRGSSVRVGNWQTSRRPRLGCGGDVKRRREFGGQVFSGNGRVGLVVDRVQGGQGGQEGFSLGSQACERLSLIALSPYLYGWFVSRPRFSGWSAPWAPGLIWVVGHRLWWPRRDG